MVSGPRDSYGRTGVKPRPSRTGSDHVEPIARVSIGKKKGIPKRRPKLICALTKVSIGKKKGIPKRHPKPICALTKQAYMTNRHNDQESFMTNRVWHNPLEFPPLHWVSTQFVTGLRAGSANWHSRRTRNPCQPICVCLAHTTRRAMNRAEFLLGSPKGPA